jgi:hypothetical protein
MRFSPAVIFYYTHHRLLADLLHPLYAHLQTIKPDKEMKHEVRVCRGDIPMGKASAVQAAFQTWRELDLKPAGAAAAADGKDEARAVS